MAGQTSMVAISYDNLLATKHFESVVNAFRPDVVHMFHLNRLGSGIIDCAVRLAVPIYMTPTDFWTVCPTAQLSLGGGISCSGPSKYSGNCVKHLAELSQRGAVHYLAHKLPPVGFEFLSWLSLKTTFAAESALGEVRAVASRLKINVSRVNKLNKVVVPNDFMENILLRHGVSPHLMVRSEFGIDVSTTSIQRPSRTNLKFPIRIGYIGTLAPHKGCDVLISAYKRLPIGKACLSIYGNLKEFPDYSNALVQSACSSSAIKFCGTFPNSEIQQVFSNLDVLVVPSRWYENTPLVVYSAQAAGCPVVASDFPGLSVVVEDNVNGLLFEPGNDEALARRVCRIVEETGLLARLSKNARLPRSTTEYVDDLLTIWASS